MIAAYPNAAVPSPFVHGLTEELLVTAVLRGEARRNEATALDAPARGGLDAHHERVRALREPLVVEDWTIDNEANYCRVVSPDGSFAIATGSGSRGTGDLHATPETARGMGEVTRIIVNVNRAQGSFFFAEEPEPELVPKSNRLTWLLLVYREGNTCKAELSLPSAVTENLTVCAWQQRYILDVPDLNPPVVRAEDDGPNDPIDVGVALK